MSEDPEGERAGLSGERRRNRVEGGGVEDAGAEAEEVLSANHVSSDLAGCTHRKFLPLSPLSRSILSSCLLYRHCLRKWRSKDVEDTILERFKST